MITHKLKKHLQESNRSEVWVNEKGEWLHHEHADYPKKVTREEVEAADLGEDTEDAGDLGLPNEESKNIKKAKKK